ncbi:MAG: ribonuclease HI family protein [Synergistaceae bacterium]|nr:ribonuclease HI family protein [Synergistaceae bacterium]
MKGYFDGAARGNPGPAGAGALLIDDNDNIIWETARSLGTKTNNEAEYSALILLLKAAKERDIMRLDVYGDSKLVICQVSKQWKINLPHLRALAEKVWDITKDMNVSYKWIPREENTLADNLSDEAIDSSL